MAEQSPVSSDAPALQAPRTGRDLALRFLGAAGSLFVGLVLFVLSVTSIVANSNDSDELERTGVHTPGRVTYAHDNRVGDHVLVRYRVEGVDRSQRVDLGSDAYDYQVGQRVAVVYDPDRPDRMSIVGEQNDPAGPITIVGLLAGFALAVTGLVKAGSWLLARRVLRRCPWRAVQAVVDIDAKSHVHLRIDGAGKPLLLRSPSTSLISFGSQTPTEMSPRSEPALWRSGTVWLAGPQRNRAVVAQPGGAPLLRVRARKEGQKRRGRGARQG